MSLTEHYKTLGIDADASIAQIKASFRKKAKSLHPDLSQRKSGAEKQQSEEKMRILLHAYQIVMQEKNRSEDTDYFDFFTKKSKADSFDYRLWLLKQSDYESRAKLIFFDLFHGLESEAVEEYNERRAEAGGFYLSKYFTREDFMDCGFVLAEELYRREEYYEAFLLLEEIFRAETEKPYFKHFFPEVLILIKSIVRDKLHKFCDEQLAIECYEAALGFGFKKSEQANLYRHLAQAYYRIGNEYKADACLKEAVNLNHRLKGIKTAKKSGNGSACKSRRFKKTEE